MRTLCCPAPSRVQRPHVYVTQEPAICPSCRGHVEARCVVRGESLVRLTYCPTCGPSEETLSDDPQGWLEALAQRDAGTIKRTTSTCPTCMALVGADVVSRRGKVYLEKVCPECGPSAALVSEDARWYLTAYSYSKAGSIPLELHASRRRGCPEDCGLCPDHEQHTCVPVVEVTDHCNLECPICLVDNAGGWHMTAERFAQIVDRLVASEGTLESIALSGGEPTMHPRLLELLDIADRPQIGRVVLLTNGLRLGVDRALAEQLKHRGVYVGLQFDGTSEQTSLTLRGRDLRAAKSRALDVLAELDIPTQLIFTAMRGVNDDELGEALRRLLSEPHILSLGVQPAAFTGRGGGVMAADPMDRLTIPGVIRALAEQSAGLLTPSDFYPLPCPSVHCVALTYLLVLDDGRLVPFSRFANLETHTGMLRNSATLPSVPEIERALEDIAYDVFARQQEIADAEAIERALRRAVKEMFPPRALGPKEMLRVGERQAKSIFIHHYMDSHDFDLERLRKCCHHYPREDGRLMPMCGFNAFHRGAARGRGTGPASWASAPPLGAAAPGKGSS